MERDELELPRRSTRRRDPQLAQDVLGTGVDQDGYIRPDLLPLVMREARTLSGLSHGRLRRLVAGLTHGS